MAEPFTRYLYLTSPHMGSDPKGHPAIHKDVLRAQHALAGYSPGPVDGNWGVTSVGATKRAQYQRGFAHVNGVFGPDLFMILTGQSKPTAAQRALAALRRRRHQAADLDGLRYRGVVVASHEIGVTENPSGSNMQKYGAWYGWNGVPWCAIFVSWCLKDTFPRFHYAYCPAILADATNGANNLSVVHSADVQAGDIALYDFDGSGVPQHTGLVHSKVIGGGFDAVEGNTGLGNDANGGQVMLRQRSTSQVVCFVRVSK